MGLQTSKASICQRDKHRERWALPWNLLSFTRLGMGTVSRREGSDEALVDRILQPSTIGQIRPRRTSLDVRRGPSPKNTAQSNRKHQRNEQNKTMYPVPQLTRRADQAWLLVGSSRSRQGCKEIDSIPVSKWEELKKGNFSFNMPTYRLESTPI